MGDEQEEEEGDGEGGKVQAHEHKWEQISKASQISNNTRKHKGRDFQKTPEEDASALMKTAHELHDKVNEFEALLKKSGDTSDAALRKRLKTICTGLASIVHHKTPQEHVDADEIEFHLEANMLRGSIGSFRDAHVDFEDMHVVIHVVDCGGNAWTLRSARLL